MKAVIATTRLQLRSVLENGQSHPLPNTDPSPILLDCKVNAEIAAPFMGEFAEFEARHQ